MVQDGWDLYTISYSNLAVVKYGNMYKDLSKVTKTKIKSLNWRHG